MKRIAHSKQEQTNLIVKRYEDLYEKNPRSKIFAPLADAYRSRGNIDKALSMCLDGVKVHPNYSSGRLALGKCYFDKRMYEKSILELSKVISANPRNIMAQTYLGKAHLGVQNYEPALKAFYKAKHIAPSNKTIEKIIDRLEIKTRSSKKPIEKRSNQVNLNTLTKKSLFTIEPDQFVLRSTKNIFAKNISPQKTKNLSPKPNTEQTQKSLQKLFLTQGLTKKASSIEYTQPISEFTPPVIQEKFTSPDKDFIRNTIIRENQISVKPPNTNHIIEKNNSFIPSTIKKRIDFDDDFFPDTKITDMSGMPVSTNIIFKNETIIPQHFDSSRANGLTQKASANLNIKKTFKDKKFIAHSAMKKLNTYLTRITERAY